jgi:REP element-mobilizing transposase RayT
MARRARSVLPDAGWWHLTARAAGREKLFRDREDCQTFLELLADTTRIRRWDVHTLCLMGTHYHLLAEAHRDALTHGFHRLNGVYAEEFNERHKRHGHLFGDRFASWIVDTEEHLATTWRYILLNPVRAGLCELSHEWPYSWSRAGTRVEA